MRSLSDHEIAETEMLLRQRIAQLAEHAPTAVQLPGEVPVVALSDHRRGRRRVGVIAAVMTLVGAGGFTTYSFLGAGNDGGAATPEEAVTTFVSAIEHHDVLGMVDVTLPEEAGVLRDAVTSITTDATRLGLLGDSFDAGDVSGVDISIDDLALSTDYLEGGLATVTATSGTLNTSIDPQKFPFGSKLRALLGGGQLAATGSKALGGTSSPALLVTVERHGRWYVSVEYTLAEYLRRSSGLEPPAPVSRTAVGFDSPEGAVSAFYQRMAALDLQGAFDMFAPGEDAMAWLAPSWMPDALAAIERGRAAGWTVAVSGLTYETTTAGAGRILKPITFKVAGTVPAHFNDGQTSPADPSWPTVVWDSATDMSKYAIVPPGQVPATTTDLTFTDGFPQLDGNYNFTSARPDGTIVPLVLPGEPAAAPLPFTIEGADGCTSYLGEGGQLMFGMSTSPLAKPVDGGFQLCGPGLGLGSSLLLLGGDLTQLPAVSVVESGGKWYVSPLGTVLASLSTSLHDAGADTSLFDTPIGAFLYGGMSRSFLESMFVGHAAADVDAACLPAMTVENGSITGVVADPPPAAVRACSSSGFTSYSSGVGEMGPASPVTPPPSAVDVAPSPTIAGPAATTP